MALIKKKELFSLNITSKKLEAIQEVHQINDEEYAFELFQLVWNMESCDEAIEVFDGEFLECPICLQRVDADGVIVHKLKKDILN